MFTPCVIVCGLPIASLVMFSGFFYILSLHFVLESFCMHRSLPYVWSAPGLVLQPQTSRPQWFDNQKNAPYIYKWHVIRA